MADVVGEVSYEVCGNAPAANASAHARNVDAREIPGGTAVTTAMPNSAAEIAHEIEESRRVAKLLAAKPVSASVTLSTIQSMIANPRSACGKKNAVNPQSGW